MCHNQSIKKHDNKRSSYFIYGIKEQTQPEEQELKKLAQAARKYDLNSPEAEALNKKMLSIKKQVHQKEGKKYTNMIK